MRILSNGNVGINTKNPTHTLSVNGTIRTKEVNVTAAGWPDYVFKPDYKLKTLSEVERFIKDNGHLPNVPSEQEVLKNGVNLLEMNVKLLEKVEELTLYTLFQEQKINDQHGMILRLSKKIGDLDRKLENIIKLLDYERTEKQGEDL